MSKQTDLLNLTDAITVDGSNVGIGTSSPSQQLHLSGSTPIIRLTDTDTSAYGEISSSSSDGNLMFFADQGNTQANTTMRFYVDASERMRLDNSGNLLVGKTSVGGTAGTTLYNTGLGYFVVDGNRSLLLDRLTSDGNLMEFRKDGSTVGSIASTAYGMQIYSTGVNNTGWTFTDSNNILPMKNSALADNIIDLGSASYRMDDIYATNGTIQTSDRNEKQDIEALSDAEQRVAVACKGLLRKFRWIDAVAEKGDDARIHFGIIAQDLQDAFAAEGLDAGRYAMFISSTWWEATETYTDDDGVEQTRVNTYETLEEAPEGATERTRLGVRYPELLAFIIGAM